VSTVLGITPEAYLQQEELAQERHEYRNGQVIVMPGGTPAHNELVQALLVILRSRLSRQAYQVFITAMRLFIPRANVYTYPDVCVTPRPLCLQPGSYPPPAAATTGIKNSAPIPTFHEYLLVDQDQIAVEHFLKHQTNHSSGNCRDPFPCGRAV